MSVRICQSDKLTFHLHAASLFMQSFPMLYLRFLSFNLVPVQVRPIRSEALPLVLRISNSVIRIKR